MNDDNPDRARDMEMRRAWLMQIAAMERRWGIEKPVVYLPDELHPIDEQQLMRHFRIVRSPRPAVAIRDG